MTGPDRDFWEQRFMQRQTPWDRGAPSPQVLRWIASGAFAVGQRVAVPGCGSGHDVVEIARAGCDVVAIDYAEAATVLTRDRLATASVAAQVIHADVLQWQPDAPLDAVYEQTCWCALHPDHWSTYATQLRRWLRPGGRLLLLAMQCRRDGAGAGRIEGPPYHMDINAVRALLPHSDWQWTAPPYEHVPHPAGWHELAMAVERR
ncbi:MAG: TPMT family class I SAM-dependent methyltransferase [Aquincola sp.]|nr:TPMT family class I SAM-dependent methyltransferase [Aquincola sp.]